LPTSKESSITVKHFIWPGIIAASSMISMVLENFYHTVLLEKDLEKRKRTNRIIGMVWMK
jgi:hypothetical protein